MRPTPTRPKTRRTTQGASTVTTTTTTVPTLSTTTTRGRGRPPLRPRSSRRLTRRMRLAMTRRRTRRWPCGRRPCVGSCRQSRPGPRRAPPPAPFRSTNIWRRRSTMIRRRGRGGRRRLPVSVCSVYCRRASAGLGPAIGSSRPPRSRPATRDPRLQEQPWVRQAGAAARARPSLPSTLTDARRCWPCCGLWTRTQKGRRSQRPRSPRSSCRSRRCPGTSTSRQRFSPPSSSSRRPRSAGGDESSARRRSASLMPSPTAPPRMRGTRIATAATTRRCAMTSATSRRRAMSAKKWRWAA
mmetsp:Transcript_9435/g.31350  ORF Transcript_9435/g.31350 Transcript_9435/m.31350 type:complete len:298 (+) Transcript_9435:1010-1903(+)